MTPQIRESFDGVTPEKRDEFLEKVNQKFRLESERELTSHLEGKFRELMHDFIDKLNKLQNMIIHHASSQFEYLFSRENNQKLR